MVSDHSVIGQYQRYWLLFNESSWSGWCTSYWLDVHNTLQTESTLLCTYSVAEIFHWLFQISFGLKTCYLPLTSIFRQSCDKHNIFRSAMIWNIETRSEQAGTELSWWTLMRHWKLSLLVWLMHELLAGFILYTRHCKLSQHYFAQIPLQNFFIGSFRSVLVWKLVITVDLYFLSVMRETQYFQKYWH